jgi:hypothetical protein
VSVARACSRRHLRMWRSGARLGHFDNTLQEFSSRCGCDRQPACGYGGPTGGNDNGAMGKAPWKGAPASVKRWSQEDRELNSFRVALIP